MNMDEGKLILMFKDIDEGPLPAVSVKPAGNSCVLVFLPSRPWSNDLSSYVSFRINTPSLVYFLG